MEDPIVDEVIYDDSSIATIAVRDLPDIPGVAARIFSALDREGIDVDLISQGSSQDGSASVIFSVLRNVDVHARDVVAEAVESFGALVELDRDPTRITVKGSNLGLKLNARIARILANLDWNIDIISSSSASIELVVNERSEGSIRALEALMHEFSAERQAVKVFQEDIHDFDPY